MLRITGDVNAVLNKAVETNSLPALQEKLEWLNIWGNDARYSVQVEGWAEKDGDMSLTFLNVRGERMMVGGLVYHEYNNSWGVHT